MDAGLIALAAAISVFTGIGAGVGIGLATGKACDAVARQPEVSGKISQTMLIGLVFAETTAIYGFVIALILLFLQ